MPEPQWTSYQTLLAFMLDATDITVEEIEQVLQDKWGEHYTITTMDDEEQEHLSVIKCLQDLHQTVTEQNRFLLQLQGSIDKLTASLNTQKPTRSRKKSNE